MGSPPSASAESAAPAAPRPLAAGLCSSGGGISESKAGEGDESAAPAVPALSTAHTPAPAPAVSDGGATVSPAFVAAAGGNSNAAAVFAAMASLVGVPRPPPAPPSGGFSDAAAASGAVFEARWPHHMRVLASMGFVDDVANSTALERSGGDLQGAINHLLA